MENKLIKPVRIKGKYGFIDNNHTLRIKPIFKYVGDFSDGYALVVKIKENHKDNRYEWLFGFIDEEGRVVYKIGCDSLKSFSEGLSAFKRDSQYGFMNKSFEEVIAPKFSYAGCFKEGMAIVGKKKGGLENRLGYINTDGEIVIPLKYDRCEEFSEGIAIVELEGASKIIDKEDNILFETETYYLRGTSQCGLISAIKRDNNKKERYGFIDKNGNIIIDFKYEQAGTFSDGLAPVRLNDKWGYINTKGEVVIDFKYDTVSLFYEGICRVGMKHMKYSPWHEMEITHYKYAYMNKDGIEITDFKYDFLNDFVNGYGVVMDDNNNTKLVDRNGDIVNILIPK